MELCKTLYWEIRVLVPYAQNYTASHLYRSIAHGHRKESLKCSIGPT